MLIFVDQLDLLDQPVCERPPMGSATGWPNAERGHLGQLPAAWARSSSPPAGRDGQDRARFPTAEVLLAEAANAPDHPNLRPQLHRSIPLCRRQTNRHAINWWTFVSVRGNE
jgi:hypothetical protein